jgi:hypothetical protein
MIRFAQLAVLLCFVGVYGILAVALVGRAITEIVSDSLLAKPASSKRERESSQVYAIG